VAWTSTPRRRVADERDTVRPSMPAGPATPAPVALTAAAALGGYVRSSTGPYTPRSTASGLGWLTSRSQGAVFSCGCPWLSGSHTWKWHRDPTPSPPRRSRSSEGPHRSAATPLPAARHQAERVDVVGWGPGVPGAWSDRRSDRCSPRLGLLCCPMPGVQGRLARGARSPGHRDPRPSPAVADQLMPGGPSVAAGGSRWTAQATWRGSCSPCHRKVTPASS
jgi:hypothetical protein